jgi:cysteine desulfurase/selenocysteine lyase
MNSAKKDFPILQQKINGHPLVYFDNASTTQKPKEVIQAISKYYETDNSNIHRGIHELSERATEQYEATRHQTAKFINAARPEEIVFTRNTTEAINIVAFGLADSTKSTDEIIVSQLEHHSNLIPWQQLTKRTGATLKSIPLNADLTLNQEAYKNLLNKNTKIIALTGMSNVTGTTPPIKEMIALARQQAPQALILVDGAQSVAHIPTDVQDLDADFLTFSAHKMLGPTGVGILYGKLHHLETLTPLNYGGSMITTVSEQSATFAAPPTKFEAGTPDIANIIAFSAALTYLTNLGMEAVAAHDQMLLQQTLKLLQEIPEVKVFTPAIHGHKAGGVVSFTLNGIHPHDIASIFNSQGIAIRSGHHCCEPLMAHLKIPATARISFYLYNTAEEVKKIPTAIKECLKIFS